MTYLWHIRRTLPSLGLGGAAPGITAGVQHSQPFLGSKQGPSFGGKARPKDSTQEPICCGPWSVPVGARPGRCWALFVPHWVQGWAQGICHGCSTGLLRVLKLALGTFRSSPQAIISHGFLSVYDVHASVSLPPNGTLPFISYGYFPRFPVRPRCPGFRLSPSQRSSSHATEWQANVHIQKYPGTSRSCIHRRLLEFSPPLQEAIDLVAMLGVKRSVSQKSVQASGKRLTPSIATRSTASCSPQR